MPVVTVTMPVRNLKQRAAADGTFRLPVELWSRVFTLSVQDDPKSRQAVMSVSRVFWSIANGSPQLWTRVVFNRHSHFTDLTYVRDVLQKSGALPIDIHLTLPYYLIRDMTPFGLVLRDHVHRLRTLVLQVCMHMDAEDLITIIGQNKPAPLLETLAVVVSQEVMNRHSRKQHLLGFDHLFHPSPRLTRVTLPAFPLPPKICRSLFCTVQDLTLDGMFADHFDVGAVISLLGELPVLQRFKFRCWDHGIYTIWHPPLHLLPLPQLHFADVTVPGSGLRILRHLDAPLLQEVRLDGWRESSGINDRREQFLPLIEVLRHLSVLSPLITTLELVNIAMSQPTENYPWLFDGSVFHSLEVLRLDAADITDYVIRICRPSSHLRRLELRRCHYVSDTGITLFAMGVKGLEITVIDCWMVSTNKRYVL